MELKIVDQRNDVKFFDIKVGEIFLCGAHLYLKTGSSFARCINNHSVGSVPFSDSSVVREVESIQVTLK